MRNSKAFTMVELVFVIVVLGILAAVAIPKLAATRGDAVLVKGKSQVSAIRSGIALQKSTRMLQGLTPFIPINLDKTTNPSNLFHGGDYGNILEYGLPIGTNDGEWTRSRQSASSTDYSRYSFHLNGTTVSFDYNASTGTFDCDHSNTNCQDLAE